MVYETRLSFDQLGIGRIDRIGEPSILGNRSSIRSDLAKKAPSRANLEDRIEVRAPLKLRMYSVAVTAPVMCCTCPTLSTAICCDAAQHRFSKIRRCYFSAAHARVSVSISIFRIKSIGRYRYSFHLQKCIGDTDSIGICVGQYRYVICLPITQSSGKEFSYPGRKSIT